MGEAFLQHKRASIHNKCDTHPLPDKKEKPSARHFLEYDLQEYGDDGVLFVCNMKRTIPYG
jgi:hypothetical protein